MRSCGIHFVIIRCFFMKNVYDAGYRQSQTTGAIRRREWLPHRRRSSAAWAVPRSAARNRVDPRERNRLSRRGARRKWCTGSRPDAIGRSHQIWAPWRRTSRPECSRYIRNISMRNKIRIFKKISCSTDILRWKWSTTYQRTVPIILLDVGDI